MKLLLIFGGAVAAVGLFLLATASADTTFFAQQYPLLLALNAALAARTSISSACAAGAASHASAATIPMRRTMRRIARRVKLLS